VRACTRHGPGIARAGVRRLCEGVHDGVNLCDDGQTGLHGCMVRGCMSGLIHTLPAACLRTATAGRCAGGAAGGVC
jgi:hypothetical protein